MYRGDDGGLNFGEGMFSGLELLGSLGYLGRGVGMYFGNAGLHSGDTGPYSGDAGPYSGDEGPYCSDINLSLLGLGLLGDPGGYLFLDVEAIGL